MAEGWIYGVLCAGLVAALGIYNVVTQHAWFVNTTVRGAGLPGANHALFMTVDGMNAVWLGAAILSGALTLHFHWFWGNHPRLSRYYEPLKLVALTATFLATMVFAVLLFRKVALA